MMAKARVQTVRDLAGSRFDWEQALRDLSRAVPADVSLTSLAGDISTGAGGGGSQLRGAISAPAITLTGCAPGQTQVARLMARLNNIDGVTRVSLSRSVAEEVTSATQASTERARAAQGPAVRRRQAAVVRGRRLLREGRRRRGDDADDRDRLRQRDPDSDPDRVGHPGRRRGHDFRFHHDRAAPGRGHPVSRTLRILIVAVVAFGAVGGYWKLVLAPKRAQVAELDQQIATQQAKLAQTQSLIATYEGAKDEYKANYATVARLGKAVPTTDDTRSLVVQLDTAAKRSSVDFDSININGGGGDGASVAPGAVNAGAFSAMPFSFSFTGDFSTLGDFFSRLERFVSLKGDQIKVSGRLLRVESINLTPGTDGWPGLNATVGASSYIVPEAARSRPRRPRPPRSTTAATTDDHDHRLYRLERRRRHPMNLITDPFRGLVRKKLWPVALLLVAALVAVPFTLAKDA